MSIDTRGVTASQPAEALAAQMLGMNDVMRAILDETIPEENASDPVIRESGRTFCGDTSDIRGPLARFPTAVELAECPRGTHGGTWHTHVTRDQLQEPTNSLPDMANVMFGDVDVSVVVGTRTAEAVIAPEDHEHGVSVFRDALGAEVDDTEDVVDAILDGRIPDPTDARQRVRKRMGSLFKIQRVNFPDLDQRVQRASIPASSIVKFEQVEAQRYHNLSRSVTHRDHAKNPVRDPAGMRAYCRNTNTQMKSVAKEMDIPQRAGDVALAAVLHRAVSSLLP